MSDRIQLKRPSHTSDTQSSQSIFTPVKPSFIPTTQPTQAPLLGHDFSRISIQPKLTVSQPDDLYEREADRVADEVMRMDDPMMSENGVMRSPQDTIHRQCAACEQEDEDLMRKENGSKQIDDKATAQVNQVVRSGGEPLDRVTRNFMEPRFEFDFSQVKIHRDSQAAESAQSIQAHAYTVGQNIIFAPGKYAPDTDSGKQLLAHELTHVVQQTGSIQTKESLQRSTPDDEQSATSAPPESSVGIEPFDVRIPFSALEPIEIPAKSLHETEPGDYPLPDDSTSAMAKLVDGALFVQRDDNDKPHPSADAQNQNTLGLSSTPPPAPWSLQGTLIYRNINIRQLKNTKIDFGHEPNISLTLDSQGGFSVQEAMTLINWHWTPPWNKELEVGLQAAATQSLLPKMSSAYGGSVQAEQHIIPWFSITLNISGTWTPPQREKGMFSASTGLGALIHFDGF